MQELLEKSKQIFGKIVSEAFGKVSEEKKLDKMDQTISRYLSAYSLILIAIIVNIVGVYLSILYKKRKEQPNTITRKELMQLPIYLSGTLFGLFILVNYVSPYYVTLLLKSYSLIYGLFCLTSVLTIPCGYVFPYFYNNRSFKLTLSENEQTTFNIEISFSDILSFVLSIGVIFLYVFYKYWFLNNLIAASFSIFFLSTASLEKISDCLTLFGGLFIYDVFWVYGSNVMVSVAKKIDAPVMFRVPYFGAAPDYKIHYSGLGLGDVVVPGMFLAFMLRYDLSKNNKTCHYFISSLVSYIVSLIICTIAVDVTGRGQPAFFFIVPLFFISTFITAFIKKDLISLFNFSVKSDEEEEKSKEE